MKYDNFEHDWCNARPQWTFMDISIVEKYSNRLHNCHLALRLKTLAEWMQSRDTINGSWVSWTRLVDLSSSYNSFQFLWIQMSLMISDSLFMECGVQGLGSYLATYISLHYLQHQMNRPSSRVQLDDVHNSWNTITPSINMKFLNLGMSNLILKKPFSL